MDHAWTCASCLNQNETYVDPHEGEHQEFFEDCVECCHTNVIVAQYNTLTDDFDLETYKEEVG
jgi:hypothetical protein